jgi:uncharacterized coiled-coil protein SlyX
VAENMTQPELRNCPICTEISLYWNDYTQLYECLNPKCKFTTTKEEYTRWETSVLNQQNQGDERPPTMPSGIGKNSGRHLVPLLMVSILLIATVVGFVIYHLQSSATISRDQASIQSLQDQKSQLDSQVASLKPQVDSLNSELSSANSRITSLDSQIAGLNSQITSLNAQLSNAQNQAGTSQSTIASLQNKVNQLQAELKLYHDTGITVYSGVQPLVLDSAGVLARLNLNPAAQNPSWTELRSFILTDSTDSKPYVEPTYTCVDYARDVYNNAEAAGIRAAFVTITFQGQSAGHAIDAFVTTDQGLIYIDCTGISAGQAGPSNLDTTVIVRPGTEYTPQFIIPQDGWYCASMGIVATVKIYW